MSLERREWIKANYRKQDVKSGVHIYIDYETLSNALEGTNIKIGEHLEIKRYALSGGKILIKFRIVKYSPSKAYGILHNYCKSHPHYKPRYCQVRGCMDDCPEGHHNDYSKPLDVVWLCSIHHKMYERGEKLKFKEV